VKGAIIITLMAIMSLVWLYIAAKCVTSGIIKAKKEGVDHGEKE